MGLNQTASALDGAYRDLREAQRFSVGLSMPLVQCVLACRPPTALSSAASWKRSLMWPMLSMLKLTLRCSLCLQVAYTSKIL